MLVSRTHAAVLPLGVLLLGACARAPLPATPPPALAPQLPALEQPVTGFASEVPTEHPYRLDAGQQLRVVLDAGSRSGTPGRSIHANLYRIDPASGGIGRTLGGVAGEIGAPGERASAPIWIAEGGDYLVRVSTGGRGAEASYTLSLRPVRALNLALGERAEGELHGDSDLAEYRLEARAAGVRVQLAFGAGFAGGTPGRVLVARVGERRPDGTLRVLTTVRAVVGAAGVRTADPVRLTGSGPFLLQVEGIGLEARGRYVVELRPAGE
jgi:hypothetical protein